MSTSDSSVVDPIQISLVAGQYLLFDNDVITYLRKTHNICGVLIGTISQMPQQNVFLGLPVELLPEEVKLLVQKGVGYIYDAGTWHKGKFSTLRGADRRDYLESLWLEGRKAQKVAEGNSQKRAERYLAKQVLSKATKRAACQYVINEGHVSDMQQKAVSEQEDPNLMLFDQTSSSLTPSSQISSSVSSSYTVTPTCTFPSLLPSQNTVEQLEPIVPASYPLFAHLHAHDYFITPGLRFGCDYAVYPGDPLRFHSHFLAVAYDWDEEIPLLDLVGGGRLGTGVKKGFLIGAEDPSKSGEGVEVVRTFCIEWGELEAAGEMLSGAQIAMGAIDTSKSVDNTSMKFDIVSWANLTQYIPSAKDLLLAGPRMSIKMGSLFLALSEAVDDVLGGRIGQRIIPEPTGVNAAEGTTTIGTFTAKQLAQTGADILGEADHQGGGLASKLSMESARSFANVFQYSTSRWALACIVMAIVLNRTHVYASTRRNLSLGWKVRSALRITPIILLSIQARSILQSIQCQTSPDFGVLRWGNASKSSDLLFTQNGGTLHTVSRTLLFSVSDTDSCRAVGMIPPDYHDLSDKPIELTGSLSRLWPLFETLCFSQFVETLSCAVQGRQVAAETGMTLFEHSLAFAEAEAAISSSLGWGPFGGASPGDSGNDGGTKAADVAIKRSMILRRVNTAPEVLLVGFLSSMSHITSHIFGILNMQGRLRLANTAFWGLCFMSTITWSILNFSIDDLESQALLRFPTVCIIGFIPHVLLFAGIVLCSLIYSLALLLTALSPPSNRQIPNDRRPFFQNLLIAHQNMQANIPLASIRVSMHMDFYTALLKTGFSALTMASEAVYLNESSEVNIKHLTWLEEDRFRELEETGAHWLGPSFRASAGEHSEHHGMADSVGLVASKDQPKRTLRASAGGYTQERVTSKVGKSRPAERMMRDGIGASERSGRWLMAFELFAGITKLIVSWSATLLLKLLAQMGIRSRPRWLLWLVRRPKASSKGDVRRDERNSTLDFWMLSDDGELVLPKDESVDVEAEMRRRLIGDGRLDERELDSNIYNWWLNGGWFGNDDSSGDYGPPPEIDNEDTTSVISMTSEAADQGWESDGTNDDGRQTPTQRSPQFSREATPLFDTPLSSADLAQLLHPKTPEHRAEGQALAAHFASDSILTRSRYQGLQQRERTKVLTASRPRPLGSPYSSLSPEEEAEILEQMIISRRSSSDGAAESKGQPSSWAEGASGLGEGGPQCVVCQSAPRSIIVWPCRCLSLCDDCRVSLAMKNFETCTCCRGRVTSFSRIFVP